MNTLKDYLINYKEKVSILKKGYAQEVFRIQSICKDEIVFKTFGEITSVDIAGYRDRRLEQLNPKTKKKISPATVRLEMSLLSHLYDIALVEWGGCTENPVKLVRKPKTPKGRDRRLSRKEENKILNYCTKYRNQDLGCIIIIALETAMRQNEILTLTWNQVNLRSRIISLKNTKNGTDRDVPLTMKAVSLLKTMDSKNKERLFNYTNPGFKSVWRKMILDLGIKDLHFHDLRHEAVSRLFEKGTLDMMEISSISGHKSLSMLKRYTHLEATKLVKKLDPKKSKVRTHLQNKFISYPAFITKKGDQIELFFPDFEDLVIRGTDADNVLKSASIALTTMLTTYILEDRKLPEPDNFIAQRLHRGQLVIIEPIMDTLHALELMNATFL